MSTRVSQVQGTSSARQLRQIIPYCDDQTQEFRRASAAAPEELAGWGAEHSAAELDAGGASSAAELGVSVSGATSSSAVEMEIGGAKPCKTPTQSMVRRKGRELHPNRVATHTDSATSSADIATQPPLATAEASKVGTAAVTRNHQRATH